MSPSHGSDGEHWAALGHAEIYSAKRSVRLEQKWTPNGNKPKFIAVRLGIADRAPACDPRQELPRHVANMLPRWKPERYGEPNAGKRCCVMHRSREAKSRKSRATERRWPLSSRFKRPRGYWGSARGLETLPDAKVRSPEFDQRQVNVDLQEITNGPLRHDSNSESMRSSNDAHFWISKWRSS